MSEPVYHDAAGRPYTVRDGVSVWLPGPPESLSAQLEYVGFWPRLAARLLDLMFTTLVAGITGVVLALLVGIMVKILGRSVLGYLGDVQQQSALSFGFSFLATVLYETAAEGIHGSTPGKMILGMTVRSSDGGYCSLTQAFKRSIALVVDGLFFGIVGYAAISESPHRQRYGDRWARTVVVRSGSLAASQRRSGLRFAAATGSAVLAYCVFVALSILA